MAPYWLRFGAAQWAARPTGNGKLLDIGCGAGSFLASAAALHWKCHGIDVSPVAIAAAKQRAPMASLRVGGMEELDLDQTNYAFINLSHVLEHLPKPRASLARCFDLLEPGGTLRIVVPNFGGWESRVFGRCWSGLDLPRHLVHFRRSVIRGLLRDVGFEGIADRPAMFASSFSESMILALPEKWRRRGLASRLARWLYLAVIFPASCSYALGNAGALEITARKPRAAGL
jgi:SAM-dependent methyltransferase